MIKSHYQMEREKARDDSNKRRHAAAVLTAIAISMVIAWLIFR